MGQDEKKKMSLKARILTVIVGIAAIVYWIIGKAENVIASLNQNY